MYFVIALNLEMIPGSCDFVLSICYETRHSPNKSKNLKKMPTDQLEHVNFQSNIFCNTIYSNNRLQSVTAMVSNETSSSNEESDVENGCTTNDTLISPPDSQYIMFIKGTEHNITIRDTLFSNTSIGRFATLSNAITKDGDDNHFLKDGNTACLPLLTENQTPSGHTTVQNQVIQTRLIEEEQRMLRNSYY